MIQEEEDGCSESKPQRESEFKTSADDDQYIALMVNIFANYGLVKFVLTNPVLL